MNSPRLRFGAFEFAPSSGELWLDGRPVRLQQQPSRLLDLLVARPGDVVTREEIRRALWADDVHVDFDRSLNFCVAKLRSALRDNAASPRFVETVPTRGYRFIAAVEAAATIAPESTPPLPAFALRRPRARRWTLWAAAAAAAVAAFTVPAIWRHRAAPPPTIVVVPFHNETGVAGLDRVAKDVSDATVARLVTPERLSRFLVIGNAADVGFSFKPATMKRMGESLGAQYLLLGQMKKDDRRLRIVAHLIRVSDQTHIWARTYDTATLDLSQQASIAEAIATSIVATLTGNLKGT